MVAGERIALAGVAGVLGAPLVAVLEEPLSIMVVTAVILLLLATTQAKVERALVVCLLAAVPFGVVEQVGSLLRANQFLAVVQFMAPVAAVRVEE